jgi:hypothetical protein
LFLVVLPFFFAEKIPRAGDIFYRVRMKGRFSAENTNVHLRAGGVSKIKWAAAGNKRLASNFVDPADLEFYAAFLEAFTPNGRCRLIEQVVQVSEKQRIMFLRVSLKNFEKRRKR